MSYPERLETPRLTLRRWTAGDADVFHRIWSDPDVWAALRPGERPDPGPAAADSHARQVRHWDERGFGLWAVIPHGECEPVGWAGAWLPDFVPELDGEIEVGWTLRRPWWSRGLATEAAQAAVTTTFEHLSPPRVISLIAPGNGRSEAVATRLGMREDGVTTTDGGSVLRVFELPAPAAQPRP